MRKALAVLTIVCLLGAVFLALGCTGQPQENAQKKEFLLYFSFEKGSALFNTITVSVEDTAGGSESREIRTVAIVKKAGEEVSELQMLMLEARSIGGDNESVCSSIPYANKKSSVKFHRDGNVEYGESSAMSFRLPSGKVKIGDTWEFGGIEYRLAGETVFRNEDGEFACLKITLDGIQSDSLGTKRVSGYFLFDPERHLKLKEETTEERPGMTTTYKNELSKTVRAFGEELDYGCLFASTKLATVEKYLIAERMFAESKYDLSLELSISAKQDLEKKKDLNAAEILLEKNNLMLLADTYGFLGMKEKEMERRLANAEYFSESLSGKKISAMEFWQAFEDFRQVSQSGFGFSGEAGRRLSDLNARISGVIKGKALLADTGKTEGLKILLEEGISEIEFESEPFGESYSLPVLDLQEGDFFSLLYYRTGYKPQALPPLNCDKNVFAGEYSVSLHPADDNSLGYLAGFCYSLDSATGKIRQFDEARFPVIGDSGTRQADCVKGFYSLLLEPGAYTIPPQEKALEVKAGETTIAHYVQ